VSAGGDVGDLRSAVIIGLGNPILSDDAVGPIVARRVHELLALPDLDLRELAVGGVELMETLFGYRKAVVIDAIVTESGKPGTLYSIDIERPLPARRTGMSHEIGLIEGIELGRRLGLTVPQYVRLYAIEVGDPFTFCAHMTGEVAEAVPRIAGEIAAEVLANLLDGTERSLAASATKTEGS
jgi:hydrogenase maturation protease